MRADPHSYFHVRLDDFMHEIICRHSLTSEFASILTLDSLVFGM